MQSSRFAPFVVGALAVVACTSDDEQSANPSSGLDAGSDSSIAAGAAPDAASQLLDGAAFPGTVVDAGGTRLTLRFQAKLGAEDLRCDRVYAGQGRTKVDAKVRDFRFFVSNVRLIDTQGAEVPLQLDERGAAQSKEVALIDFTDGTGSCTSGGSVANTIVTGTVPAGQYSGLVFSSSVPEQLNHANPELAPTPLRTPGAFWDWLQGYRFVMAELLYVAGGPALDAGAADAGTTDASAQTDGGGPPSSRSGLGLVHVGSTGCIGGSSVGFQCSKQNRNEIRLARFDATRDTIVADLSALFAEVDLTEGVECHARGDFCASMLSALGIDLTNGAPLATQRVFRSE